MSRETKGKLHLHGTRVFPVYDHVLADKSCSPMILVNTLEILAEVKADRSHFLPAARKYLLHAHSAVRYKALVLLGSIGDSSDTPVIAAFFSHDPPDFSGNAFARMAAYGLANIGTKSSLTAIDVWLISESARSDNYARKYVESQRARLEKRLAETNTVR